MSSHDDNDPRPDLELDLNLDDAIQEWDDGTPAAGADAPERPTTPGAAPAQVKPAVPKPAVPKPAVPKPGPRAAPPGAARPAIPRPAAPANPSGARPLYRPPTPGPGPSSGRGKSVPGRPGAATPKGPGAPPRPAIPKAAPRGAAGATKERAPAPGVAAPRAPAAPKAPVAPPSAGFDDFSDFDEHEGATTIGEVPEDLISSLKGVELDDHDRPTKPPAQESDLGGVDLDLDELLNELEAPQAGSPQPPSRATDADGEQDRPTAPPPSDVHDRVTREAVQEDLGALVTSAVPTAEAAVTPRPEAAEKTDDAPDISIVDEDDDLLAELDALAAPLEAPPSDAPGPSTRPPDPPADERPTQRPPPGMVLEENGETIDLSPPPVPLGAVDDDLEERPTRMPPPPSEAMPTDPPPEVDAGAVAARRTVRYRKPREEHFPLAGRTQEALLARRELLSTLAASGAGSAAARLWVAAAEMSEQLGDFDRAHDAYHKARAADAKDLVALRALRRYAVARDEYAEAASLLEAEAALDLAAHERAHAFTLLAEIALTRMSDPMKAERHARAAIKLQEGSVAPRILLAEARRAQDKAPLAQQALQEAAERWADPHANAVLCAGVAVNWERQGATERARKLFAQATASDDTAVDAWLGLARTARASGDAAEVARALQAAGAASAAPLREVFHRLAARVQHVLGNQPAEAVSLLGDARSALAQLTKADAAAAAGDGAARRRAMEEWIAATGGTDRALGLVMLAELCVDEGDLEAADAALKDAALADGKLATVRVAREVLARRAGDASRLARVVQGTDDGSLAAAAKAARDPSALSAERELLARGMEEGDSPVTADIVGLDAAATARDVTGTAEALRRQAERTPPDHRLGPLLTLARMFLERDDTQAARTVLREARDLFPGDALALRPLSRLVAPEDPREAAAMWLEEASVSEGVQSAFAATWAGRILAHGGGDAAGAFRRALDVEPGYLPAAWALEPLVRAEGDPLTLEEIHEQLAETEADPVERAGRLLRAALLRGERDPEGAAALLSRAREIRPDDAILTELLLRLAGGMSPSERAELLEQSATHAPAADLARSARLRAAAAWLDAGEPKRAATLYAQVLEAHPGDPFAAEPLDRSHLAAGEPDQVAHRLLQAVEASSADEAARVAALDALASFELHERGDLARAAGHLRALVDKAPGHIPSLRALERHFMDAGQDGDLLQIEQRLAAHLSSANDVAAHLRLARRLHLRADGATGAAADDLLLEHAHRAAPSLWLARRVEAVTRTTGDAARLVEALEQVLQRLDGANERTSLLLRIAEVLETQSEHAQAAERLAPALEGTPDHPVVADVLGRLRVAAADPRGAAEAFELAADSAQVDRRRVAMWYRAGVLWQDDVSDPDRAMAAFQRAAAVDVRYEDLFDRLRTLLAARNDTEGLSALMQSRLAAGGDPKSMVGLHLGRADLCEQLGDRDGARQALRAALDIEADRVDALRRLAGLCMDDEDWREATEALIRVARLRQDREELRWVFFQLGEIYRQHMPDPQRAEQAYRRVLKINAHDVEAMGRLATLLREQGRHPEAAEVLRELCNRDPAPDRRRDHRLLLAEVLEEHGDLRGAEAELEHASRGRPSDLAVLRAVADFYRRQNAESALSVHLGRAVGDLRQALANDPLDEQAWRGLVEVFRWRGLEDASRCCASAAAAFGVLDIELARLLDPKGGAPGAGPQAVSPAVDDRIAPSALSPAVRRIFEIAAEAFEKVLPFDTKAARVERVGRDAPLRREAQEAARLVGVNDAQVLLSDALPRVCMPIQGSPVTVLMGRDLWGSSDAGERLVLLVRAIRLAQAQLSVVVRTDPVHLGLAMDSLTHAYDPAHVPTGADVAQVADLARRLKKAVPRRARDELGPLLLEARGSKAHDPLKLAEAAFAYGNRFALVALGSFPDAVSALLKTAHDQAPGADRPEERAALLRQTPEAWSLFNFAISDAHFAARKRAGLGDR